MSEATPSLLGIQVSSALKETAIYSGKEGNPQSVRTSPSLLGRVEAGRGKLRDWKPPKQDHFPSVLLTCRELYISGVQNVLEGNTFSFEDLKVLRKVLNTCR